MRDYLLFQLYAPLASWGDQAVGPERPSADHPSRSALLGLLAAALGIERRDDAAHARLSGACRFGVKLHAPGLALRDFHSIQTPPENRRAHHRHTRRDALREEKLGTLLSYRSYRQDSASVVAVWLENDEYALQELAGALTHPHYPLYLGRKSCPPALPLHPCIIGAGSLRAALDDYEPDAGVQGLGQRELRYYWETCDHHGMGESWRAPRYDQPLSRRRWQFTSRDEHLCLVREEG